MPKVGEIATDLILNKDNLPLVGLALPALTSLISTNSPEILQTIKSVVETGVNGVSGEWLLAGASMIAVNKLWNLREKMKESGGILSALNFPIDALIAGTTATFVVSEISHLIDNHNANAILGVWAGYRLVKILLDRKKSFSDADFGWLDFGSYPRKLATGIALAGVLGASVLNPYLENKLNVQNLITNPQPGIQINLTSQDLDVIRGVDSTKFDFLAQAVSGDVGEVNRINEAKTQANNLNDKAESLDTQLSAMEPKIVSNSLGSNNASVVIAASEFTDFSNTIANLWRPQDRQVILVGDVSSEMKNRANQIQADVVKAQASTGQNIRVESTPTPSPIGVSAKTEILQCEDVNGPYDYIVQSGDIISVDSVNQTTDVMYNLEGRLMLSKIFGDVIPDGVVDIRDGAQALCDANPGIDCMNVQAGNVLNIPCPTR